MAKRHAKWACLLTKSMPICMHFKYPVTGTLQPKLSSFPRNISMETYKTLEITQFPNSPVFNLSLNNPSLHNALSRDFFLEFPIALSSLDQNPNALIIILSGNGKHFCSGIEINTLNSVTSPQSNDHGRIRERLRRDIKGLQDAITAIELCRKPVIAAIHGACIGGGIDIVTACDIRYCTEDSFFSVKEVDLGLTADLGTLQRLPRIVGYGNAIELALTGRRFGALEAKSLGLVSKVFGDKKSMDEEVRAIAEGMFLMPVCLFICYDYCITSRDGSLVTVHHGYVSETSSDIFLCVLLTLKEIALLSLDNILKQK